MPSRSSENALLSVMVTCKESQEKDADPCDIGSVLISTHFSPISVDPTFDLGDFSVTVVSYHYLMLKNRRTGKNHVMSGPMMVHRRKLFSTYFFTSSLMSLNPSIAQLQSFGIDIEEYLYSAFDVQFPFATHLRCFYISGIAVKQNYSN